jgi:hypothetical protein
VLYPGLSGASMSILRNSWLNDADRALRSCLKWSNRDELLRQAISTWEAVVTKRHKGHKVRRTKTYYSLMYFAKPS